MKSSINADELIKGLETGSITVDFMGHDIPLRNDDTPYTAKDYLILALEVDYDREFNYVQLCEARGEDIASFKSRTIEREYVFNEDFLIPNYTCLGCGKRLSVLPVAKDVVKLFHIKEYDPSTGKGNIERCEAESLAKPRMLTSEILVSSGELFFFNVLDDKNFSKREKGFSVSSLVGRNNLMQYLATQNIGYGQMTNTSVSVFANPDGTEIIISTEMEYDDDGEEYTVEHIGYTKIGNISLDVWRWMCADWTVLKANKINVRRNLAQKPNQDTTYVRASVKPGKWIIEHYYEFPNQNDLIYSKLYLKQEEPAN